MMLFLTTRVKNDIVLNQLSLIQNDVIWVSDNYQNDAILDSSSLEQFRFELY